MFRKFLKARDGNVAMMFGIVAVPVILASGAAVDYTNVFQQQQVLQGGIDAAALAANRVLGVLPKKDVEKAARNFFDANVAGKLVGTPTLAVVIGEGTVEVTASLDIPTWFLGIAGIDSNQLNLHSKSVAGDATYEVVMVLDNSGSMAGSKISSLREAANDLSTVLFEVNKSNPNPDPIKIGIVPFAASVNVGAGYAREPWMDTGAKGPYHSENFDKPASRFDLFKAMDGMSWQGCVEARPHPYDVDDTEPTDGKPETLFVPMFAPDEPDYGGFSNNYLGDDGGSCLPVVTDPKQSRKSDEELALRQSRICKYDKARLAGGSDNGVKFGPNINCTAEPLMTLSTSESEIAKKLEKMKADGMTNIHSGVMWGWRLLSPGAPFTDGRGYDDEDNRKILIVMTDGENTYNTYNNIDKSMYGAFGYVAKNHLDTTSSNSNIVTGKMDERTLEACTNAKAERILIYTVAFKVTDKSTLKMLTDCATSAKMAFRSDSNSELVETFRAIAQEISLLRLEE